MDENYENEYLVDLYDEDGNMVTFEHLDTIQLGGSDYIVCIPYDDDEEDVTEVAMFKVVEADDDESCLEQVVDADTAAAVYEIFKERNTDKFDFED